MGDVHDHLKAQSKIAYTTVMTTMGRLADKGVLERGERRGIAYHYRSVYDRPGFCAAAVAQVLDSLVAQHGPIAKAQIARTRQRRAQ